MSVVLYEKRDQIAYITLNRPEVLNAVSAELNESLAEAWTDYRDDPSLLVAIVTGAGRAFSAGADLKEMAARGMAAGTRPLNTPVRMEVWKPIIAAIDGYALAGGFGLALSCDIRIATERSRLGDIETRVSSWGNLHVLNAVPLGEVLYLLLTGNHISAEEAFRVGLIHKVLPDRDALMQEAQAIAEDIKLCAPLAVQAIKRIAYMSKTRPWEEMEAFAQSLRQDISKTEDAMEGPRSFAEKRKPVWKMR